MKEENGDFERFLRFLSRIFLKNGKFETRFPKMIESDEESRE